MGIHAHDGKDAVAGGQVTDGVEIARVERDGALLSVVKDRRPLRVKDLAALARRGGVRDRRHPMLKD